MSSLISAPRDASGAEGFLEGDEPERYLCIYPYSAEGAARSGRARGGANIGLCDISVLERRQCGGVVAVGTEGLGWGMALAAKARQPSRTRRLSERLAVRAASARAARRAQRCRASVSSLHHVFGCVCCARFTRTRSAWNFSTCRSRLEKKSPRGSFLSLSAFFRVTTIGTHFFDTRVPTRSHGPHEYAW